MNGHSVWYGEGPSSPRTPPSEALRAAGLDPADGMSVTLGWTVEGQPWMTTPDFRGRAVMPGYGLARAIAEGRVTTTPTRFSAIPRLIQSQPPDVAIVTAVRRGNGFAFAETVGSGDVLTRTAARVVLEVDDDGFDLGGPEIEGNIVATLPRPPAPAIPPAAARAADEIDLRIGATVVGLLPTDATLQFGPGGIGEGIARALDRPVRIWSGLLTDEMAELHRRGLLIDRAVVAFTWGGEAIRELAAAGRLELAPVGITHDLTRISSIPGFVGCNTAIQVGLDGSVNVERVGGRVISGVGGHSDFCTGASRSIGGLSVIAIRSTTPSGASVIVPRVDVVSTQRSDIDVVVTEHGIADLRGVDGPERTRRLIAVAAPDHRADLTVMSA